MLPAPLNFNRLRLFAAVVEHGSVTRAAAALDISQPAVTKAVHDLERDLRVPLLDHAGRGVVPTEAGRLLAEYARRIFALAGEAERALGEFRGLARGRLAVGASTTIGIYLLPELLGVYRQRHAAIELFLDIANTQTIVERLHARLLDLALVEGPVEHDDLLAEPFRPDELALVTAPDHPLARGGATVADLAALPWVMREPGSGTRDVVERALAAAGVAPRVVMELGSTEAIKRAVAAGLGVSIVSRAALGLELAAGRLAVVPVAGFRVERTLTILQRRATRPSPATTAFLGLLRE
ncbi:MAG TPA: LysR family transcriptional regulator [Thermomicrobiales bacterium]|nr:LysR family transcriptional regulator [Thermomicrobiales bacterium]